MIENKNVIIVAKDLLIDKNLMIILIPILAKGHIFALIVERVLLIMAIKELIFDKLIWVKNEIIESEKVSIIN